MNAVFDGPAIHLVCQCGHDFEVSSELAGQTANCPACDWPILVAQRASRTPPMLARPRHGLRTRGDLIFGLGSALVFFAVLAFLYLGLRLLDDKPIWPAFALGFALLITGFGSIVCGHLCHIRAALEEANSSRRKSGRF